jgi:hypothetical protein
MIGMLLKNIRIKLGLFPNLGLYISSTLMESGETLLMESGQGKTSFP